MEAFIELDIYGHIFLLITQEYGHRFWIHIVTMIDSHGTKVGHDPCHTHFIDLINDCQYEKVMSCNKLPIIFYKREIRKLCGNSKASLHMKKHLM